MLFLYLLKVSLLVAVLTLGYRWMVQFESYSRLNRALLWFNVLAAWTMPFIPMPEWGPTLIQEEFHQSIPKVAEVAPRLKNQIAPYNPAPTVLNSQRLNIFNLMDWLLIIYLAGVLILSVRFILQVGLLARVIFKSTIEKTNGKISFVKNSQTKSPYSFFWWIVIDPENHSPQELQHIIAHETEHVVQWHSLDLLVSEMQCIVLWFNPFVWFHQKLVRANLEYLADRAVIESGVEKRAYQYSLVRTVLQSKELPLTNSFAQSLLKNRIRMMNKKPSHYSVLCKYAVLIAILYVSSAFVTKFKRKLVQLAPLAAQTVIESFQEKTIETRSFKKEAKPDSNPTMTDLRNISVQEQPVDYVAQQPDVRGILIRNDTLYWSVSPLMTIADLGVMRKTIGEFGGDFMVENLEIDPLKKFITAITIYVRTKSGSTGLGSTEGKNFMPIRHYSGYLLKNGLSIGAPFIPDPLNQSTQADYQQALALYKQNDVEYANKSNPKIAYEGNGITFSRELLEGKAADVILERSGVGKSAQNTLLVAEMYRNSELYLNMKKVSIDELNALSFDQLVKVEIRKDKLNRKYVIVDSK